MAARFRYIALVLLFQLAVLKVIAQPKASFTVSATSGCSPLSETFNNTTTGGTAPYTYLWELGNSNLSTLKNASAIYYTPGTYHITLVVTDAKGKTDSTTHSITVYKSPTADFSATVKAGCAPMSVTFKDASTAGSAAITKWLWDFGDGTTSSSRYPGSHTYSTPGKYSVSLEVTDANGCTSYIILPSYIVVDKPPTVSISASATYSCTPPLKVNFSSTVSPSKNVTYSWDFGDGTSGTGANPPKTYNSDGSFDVTLTVTDSLGCTAMATLAPSIFVGKPKASFANSTSSGCAPLTVTFANTSVGAPAGSKYSWDFGDGSTSTSENPSHTYGLGSYTVTLIVTAPGGCADTVVVHDDVNVTQPFVPSFTADTFLCQPPYGTTFTNTSGANTTVVSWDFGDGSPAGSGNQVSHSFAPGGYYSITLTVVDKNGCVESITRNNLIHAGATTALFDPRYTKGCAPKTVTFTNSSTSVDSIVSYLWDFGDGTTSNAANPPPHTYTKAGTYTVSLTIKTRKGCTNTFYGAVALGLKPKANFTSYPDSGCLNMLRNVQFINLTNVNATVLADSFSWDFGVGTTASEDTFYVRFNDTPGVYEVTLIAYDKGCPDTLKKDSLIKIAPPWAMYGVTRDSCALQNTLHFIDKSIGASHVEYYFGDGDSSNERSPTHVYKDSGLYYPIQIAYDSSNGCSDTFSYFDDYPIRVGLFIKPPWKDSIRIISDTVGCSPYIVSFNIFDNDTAINEISYGDGDTEGFATPVDLDSISHTYQKPGIYKVTMRAINDQGCKDSFDLKPEIVVLGLKVAFSVSPLAGCAPLTVTLIDSFPNPGNVTSNYYAMGDGDTVKATSGTITYTYTKAPPNQANGYQIYLIVGNGTCTDTAKKTVYPEQPIGQIDPFNVSSCDSVAYDFIPEAKGYAPFKFLWDFGNGDTTSHSPASRTFGVGDNRVKLSVTDSLGCVDTLSLPISVPSTSDTADFTIKLSPGSCPPITAYFIDASKFSVPGGHQWSWDFGDGSPISTLENPSKVYYTAGNFTVTLKIKDILGCTSTAIKPNVVSIKGPTGVYSFDSRGGCAPVTVHFRAQSNNATKFSWDFGDGSPFGSFDTSTHVYTLPGTYKPSLVLSDNSCTYPLPPIDSIVVYPLPNPDFGYDSTCAGQPITFQDLSTSKNPIVHWVWNFGDGSNTDSHQSPTHIYKRNGFYPVTLTVTNNSGCKNSITKSVKYGDIIARFKAPLTGCMGYMVQFTDLTLSDSAIKSWDWDFGDGSSSNLQNPAHTYLNKGIYPVSLYVENYKGCYDTLKDGANIIIGDTVPPKPPVIYRVTVIDDHNIEIDYGQNRDFDFEKYRIFARDENGKVWQIDSSIYPSDTIKTESGLNNLHHSYCFIVQVINACGYASDTSSSLFHCTINLDAKPGINEALLNWTSYIGWPVDRYKIYRQGSETPPQFDILDSVPGSQLKYTDTSVVCYRPMVYRVEGIEKNGNSQISWSDTAAPVPIHVPKVPAADMVRATVENNKSTLVEWQTVPNAHVKNWMLEKSDDGVNFMALDTLLPAVLSEADQKVNVQKSSYTYRLRILDSCEDLGPYGDIGKTILLNIDTSVDVKPYLVWSAYKNWPEGVQYYDIYIENMDKNFDWLARTPSGQDTEFVDNITDLNSLPFYTYHVVAHRDGTILDPNLNLAITSTSNDATLRPHSRLYIPNVFTPNGDGINDSFFVQGLYIKDFHIKIFDRWGTKVFEANSMKEKWSGSYKNGPPIMDAYKYLIYYRGVDNIDRYTDGWVTILL